MAATRPMSWHHPCAAPVVYAMSGLTSIARDKLWQDQFNLELFVIISCFDYLVAFSFPFMAKFQGYRMHPPMSQSVYERIRFRCLVFLLGLHPECSLSGSLSCFDLEYLFQVRFRACAQSVMAPVVRVEPCEMKLLDTNPEILSKVEVVGWLPFISKFLDSNPEVTRVFAVSLADFQVKVGDLQFRVDERSVALATGFPLVGE